MDFFKKIGEKIKSDTKLQNTLRICAIALVALIVLIVICSVAFKKAPYTLTKDEYKVVNDEESFHLLRNGKVVKAKLDGESATIRSRSLDGSAIILETTDEDGFCALYAIVKGKAHEIKVDDSPRSLKLAAEGKNFAFTDKDGDLYTGTVSNGKVTKVKAKDEVSSFILSPNGKVICYEVTDDDEIVLYMHKGSKETKIGKNLGAILVDDNGKYIYCADEDGNLLSYNARAKKTKVSKELSTSYVMTNLEHTEVIYEADGKSYVSVKGKEGKKLPSGFAGVAYPDAGAVKADGNAITYPVKTFKGQYVAKSDKIGILKNNWEFKEIADDVVNAAISENGKIIYFLNKDGELHLIKGKKATKKAIAEDIVGLEMLRNGKGCYVLNEDEELHYVSGKSYKKKTIVEDVDDWTSVTKDGIIFVTSDDEIYPVKGASKKKSLGETEEIDVTSYVTYSQLKETDGDTYDLSTCQKGYKFKKVLKEVKSQNSYFDW